MIRTQVYFPRELKQELESLAQLEKKPVAEIIRRAVKREVARKRETGAETLFKIAQLATPGPRDLSEHLFDYLYGKKSDYATKKRHVVKKPR